MCVVRYAGLMQLPGEAKKVSSWADGRCLQMPWFLREVSKLRPGHVLTGMCILEALNLFVNQLQAQCSKMRTTLRLSAKFPGRHPTECPRRGGLPQQKNSQHQSQNLPIFILNHIVSENDNLANIRAV